MRQIWLLGTVGIARGDPDHWQKTSQVTFSQSNQSPEQVLPSLIHAEHKHIVFTRITNYVRSAPAPASPSFPLFGTSDCNAPKWLPSALHWRHSQLGVNSGDGSIQKPQNEASCDRLMPTLPLTGGCCLTQAGAMLAHYWEPDYWEPAGTRRWSPGGLTGGPRWRTWTPQRRGYPWRCSEITWLGSYINNLDICKRICLFLFYVLKL